MESNLLAQGGQLMLVGMGTVFVFLTALVGATTLMSSLAMQKAPAAAPVNGDNGSPSEEEIAAIGAAISQHRRQ